MRLGYFKEFKYPNAVYEMKDYISDGPYEMQGEIVSYLKSGEKIFASTRINYDVIAQKRVYGERVVQSDGIREWDNMLIYYIEKYNLRLPKEDEDYVLEKIKTQSSKNNDKNEQHK